ncbi:MAG: hypothetical protein ABIF77_19530 [bacterium]
MKLIGLMSLVKDKEVLHDLFEKHDVQVFSKVDIEGHTIDTITKYGWFASDNETPFYSTLCFAIIGDSHADAIMEEIGKMYDEDETERPIRAFQVDVERMV